jgi:hypothetical protein
MCQITAHICSVPDEPGETLLRSICFRQSMPVTPFIKHNLLDSFILAMPAPSMRSVLESRQHIPRAGIIPFPGRGHGLMYQFAEEVVRAVTVFLEQIFH